MAVKYKIQYKSVNDIDYVCDISNNDYDGEPIILDGSVEYGMNAVDTLDNPIRAKYLTITVTATLDQDLEDLLTQGERYWRVEFYRDSNKIFFGYLTSEQSPQSFVTDSWDLTLDALDPLAFLEDLAYVDNTGSEYNGDERLGRIVANCLKRGFQDSSDEFNILAYIPYDYRIRTGVSTYTEYDSGLFMTACTISQDEFIDEDSDEVKSCQEVLTDILTALQLTVTQIDGNKWLITHFLYDTSGIESKYIEWFDSDWIGGGPGLKPSAFSSVEIKTDDVSNDSTDIIHVNENQQYYFNYLLGKKVIDFEYKYKDSLIVNAELDGGTAGFLMPNWTVDTDIAYPNNDGTVRIYRIETGESREDAMVSTGLVYTRKDQLFKLQVYAETNFTNSLGVNFGVNVDLEDRLTATVYSLAYDRTSQPYTLKWSSSPVIDYVLFDFPLDDDDDVLVDEEFLFELELPPLPSSSIGFELVARVSNIGPTVSPTNTTDYVIVHSVDVVPNVSEITGTSTIANRTDEDGFKADKSSIYINTGEDTVSHNVMRYEFGATDPITHIKDRLYDDTTFYGLSEIKAHNDLINQKLKRFFTGDFWNFFEPHNIINIPDLNDNDFRVLEYSFQTKENVGTIKLEENETTTVTASVDTSNIYANTVKPTIK